MFFDTVDSLIKKITKLSDKLAFIAERENARVTLLKQAITQAQAEADRASRISSKLNALIS